MSANTMYVEGYTQEQIKETLNKAFKCASKIVELHPEFYSYIQAGNIAAVQYWIEQNFCKTTNEEWVINELLKPTEQDALKNICEEVGVKPKLVFKAIARTALHRRIPHGVFFNMFQKYFDTPEQLFNFAKKCKELQAFDDIRGSFVVKPRFTLSPNAELELDLHQSNPSMICRPKTVKVTKETIRNGYLSLCRDVFTKKADRHIEVPTDFLNIQNRVAYTINFEAWDNFISTHPYVPKRKATDDDAKWEKKIIAADRQHFKKAFIVYLYRLLGINKIYILTQYDYRGRNYPIAYLLNPQGTDCDKGLLSFADFEEITPQGEYWLKVSIANTFNNADDGGKDLDKRLYRERIAWYEQVIAPMIYQTFSYKQFLEKLISMAEKADSPACFFVQCDAMYKIVVSKRFNLPLLCNVITHFDATASGYQIQAIWTNDHDIGKLTNIFIPKGMNTLREDIYTSIYLRLLAAGIPDTYSRTQIKKVCLIPAIYNSIRCIKECFPDKNHQKIFHEIMNGFLMWRANRKFPFLWNDKATSYTFTLPDGFKVYKTVKVKVEKTIEYEEETITLEGTVNLTRDWSLELGPNMTHSCDGMIARELVRRCSMPERKRKWIINLYDHEEEWTYTEDKRGSRALMKHLLELGKIYNFYSFRILHEITPANIDLVPKELMDKFFMEISPKTFSIVEIHDSFGVNPNYASILMMQYRMVLRDLALSQFLPVLMDFLQGNELGTTSKKIDKEFVDSIMRSEYALC